MNKPLTTVEQLVDAELIAPDRASVLGPVSARYAVAVTPEMAALIGRGDPSDPIARQFLPSEAELITTPEERADPIGDNVHSPVEGIVHRHRDRVLLKIVGVCPVYCRFCFRRASIGPGAESALSPAALEQAFAYIAAHREIWEVILTGGDPFVLSLRRAREVTERLASIPHVRVIRWHTRVPVADPARVTTDFARALKTRGAATIVAVHSNHPCEFTREAVEAIRRLVDGGIPLLSQTVLLKGVNDQAGTLESLMRRFVENRIKPYYLHHPDLAPGTSHFRVTIDEGLALMAGLRKRLSGVALPRYVLDLPGGFGKVALESTNVERLDDGRFRIRDPDGTWHAYPPVGEL